MTSPTTQKQFAPKEDYVHAWPLIEQWPGLRSEIKLAIWELWHHCPAASNHLRTSFVELGQWWAKPGRPPRAAGTVSRILARLQELALITYTLSGDGWIGILLVDPAALDRTPVGSARRHELVLHQNTQPVLFETSTAFPRCLGLVTGQGEHISSGDLESGDSLQPSAMVPDIEATVDASARFAGQGDGFNSTGLSNSPRATSELETHSEAQAVALDSGHEAQAVALHRRENSAPASGVVTDRCQSWLLEHLRATGKSDQEIDQVLRQRSASTRGKLIGDRGNPTNPNTKETEGFLPNSQSIQRSKTEDHRSMPPTLVGAVIPDAISAALQQMTDPTARKERWRQRILRDVPELQRPTREWPHGGIWVAEKMAHLVVFGIPPADPIPEDQVERALSDLAICRTTPRGVDNGGAWINHRFGRIAKANGYEWCTNGDHRQRE